MRHIILLLLATVSVITISYSQSYIDATKKTAKESLENTRKLDKELNININETDTTLTYLIRDSSVQNFDFILYFDKKGKCYKEKNILTCDSCYQKFIQDALSNKHYRWTKINSTTYFTNYPHRARIIFNTKADKEFSFEIFRSEMTVEEYKKQLKTEKWKNKNMQATSAFVLCRRTVTQSSTNCITEL